MAPASTPTTLSLGLATRVPSARPRRRRHGRVFARRRGIRHFRSPASRTAAQAAAHRSLPTKRTSMLADTVAITGATGSPGALTRDAGARWFTARRWSSSCSPTSRPAPSSPLPPAACPSIAGGARNWDYRYTWIRDAAFTMYSLMRIGFVHEAAKFMRWIEDRCAERKPGQLPPEHVPRGRLGRSRRDSAWTISPATKDPAPFASATPPSTSFSSISAAN